MEIFFTKLEGNGNDFILIDEYNGTVIPDEMKPQFAQLYCDRRFGIGADGVLFLSKSADADVKMRLFQPDGSEAEMCGNGIRCFAKYAFETGYVTAHCRVETPAGVADVALETREEEFYATVTMPTPKFDRKDIPATGDGEYKETVEGLEVYAVNTGVPHAVVIVGDVDTVDIAATGPKIRNHASFPKGANVNFVLKTGPDAIRIRTFERGVEDETYSCGTGATAAAAVAHKLGLAGETVAVETNGGPLTVCLGPETKMEGPASTVFTGIISF
jgi:diaminopimelate epimerase